MGFHLRCNQVKGHSMNTTTDIWMPVLMSKPSFLAKQAKLDIQPNLRVKSVITPV